MCVIKCSELNRKRQQVHQNATKTAFVDNGNQMIYSINGRLSRVDSVISFESAMKNSSLVLQENIKNECYLPTYDSIVKMKLSH